MNVKILVAAHKPYKMPSDRQLYLPMYVGKTLHQNEIDGYTGDDTGNNISDKNGTFNELTAIYWAWKNLDADAIGLDHYRRYMSLSRKKDINTALSQDQVARLFEDHDIILPKKRNYFIQTNYDHYVHAHHKEPLDDTAQIIKEKYPDYIPSYNKVMQRKSAHMFNMFLMKRDKFNEYCEWMFDILFELESRTSVVNYSQYEQRVYGFVSELLLDVWLDKNSYDYVEVNFVHMESQHWIKKGFSFLLRALEKPKK
ncbi:exopolysaccharide biosynthesis protein [Paucilactobacillus hokkaidonensis JCM 18461]|uniref:Exopolysaccharide biosynthesis protein n=2 Tax=Paucilactobacillus hokkaidonensis TaxID=1193095 RepID=A0A0A1GXN7_9LACO|nr:DUF4422 domain-containing protein [Paucilactobacillus hokkaidonensis]KRO09552.1 glycosyltransferase [Paucilactobacillus hokkaidonensis]BAP85226.1 exopolysaccharide biosynthesis protein [Paucilactobacillus hokkaidonensis JCM 18461]